MVIAGVRHRQFLGVRDHHAAQVRESEVIRRLEMLAAGLPVQSAAADGKPLDMGHEYERELQRRGSSFVHVRKTVHRVTALLGKARRLADVTPVTIRRALDRLHTRGTAAQTINGTDSRSRGSTAG